VNNMLLTVWATGESGGADPQAGPAGARIHHQPAIAITGDPVIPPTN
jgi:hypothetical protein